VSKKTQWIGGMEMARKGLKIKEKTLKVGILNFKIHTKVPDRYEKFFKLISEVELVKVRGTEFGTVGYLRKSKENFLFGEIYLFLNIDPSSPWYDAKKRAPIEPDAIGMETRVFDRLKPHLKQRAYLFDLRNHRLYFDTQGFSPNAALTFFEQLCTEANVIQEIGEIDIEVHSSLESIDEILSIPNLTYLETFITLPNPEDLTESEAAVYAELQAEGLLSIKEIRKSDKEEGINPQPRTRNLVRLSRTEGYTRARGFMGDELVIRHTDEHPQIIHETYFEKTEKPVDALMRVADSIFQNLTG
jgi:hypothetical protein